MGFFDKVGSMFEKKHCDNCGKETGAIFGNNSIADGNLCNDCANKLSPWFTNRSKTPLAQIKEQLAYREANRAALPGFSATRTFGNASKKLYVDETHGKFAVASSSNFATENPDILDFAQAGSCEMEIRENREELKDTVDGKRVSYNPPRYKYAYDFYVTIHVSHKYFNSMKFKLNSSSVDMGEQRMGTTATGWNMSGVSMTTTYGGGEANYNKYVNMGNEIKRVVECMRTGGPIGAAGIGAVGMGADIGAGLAAAGMNGGAAGVIGAAIGALAGMAGAGAMGAQGTTGMGAGMGMGGMAGAGTMVTTGTVTANVPYQERLGAQVMPVTLTAMAEYGLSVANPTTFASRGGAAALPNLQSALNNEISMGLMTAIAELAQQGVPSDQIMNYGSMLQNQISMRGLPTLTNLGLTLGSFRLLNVNIPPDAQAMIAQFRGMNGQMGGMMGGMGMNAGMGGMQQQGMMGMQQQGMPGAYQQMPQQGMQQGAMGGAWQCQYCGAQNAGGNFCQGCGSKKE